MIHILFMILKALGILLLVLLFLVLLIVCTVLFLPFCYRAQVLKEEEGFACVKASGRVSWLFGAVALMASYEEQKPEAQILLFGASLETWKRRLKKIRRGEASVPRTEENETENAPEAEKTAEQKAEAKKEQTSAEQPAEQKTDTVKKQMPQRDAEKTQKAPDQTEKQQKVTAQKEQPEQEQEPDAPKKSILERFFGRIEYLPEKLLNLASRLLQMAFRLLELPFRLLEKLEQKIHAGRRLKRKWESVKKFFRSKMFREALLHAKKEVLYFLKKAAPKKVTGTVRFGFNDPALTGETLGILGMIYGKLPKDLSIQPDFEQEILQGDVRMKGSFQAVTAAGIALRLFRDQNLRKTIRHFKHKEA